MAAGERETGMKINLLETKEFSSQDLKNAYSNLQETVKFGGCKESKSKQKLIERLRETGKLEEIQEILKNKPLIYPGGLNDIEYPLVLGARDIIIFDPRSDFDQIRDKIEDRYDSDSTKEQDETSCTLAFNFDFGNSTEEVTLKIIKKYFPTDTAEDRIRLQENSRDSEYDEPEIISSDKNSKLNLSELSNIGVILEHGCVGQDLTYSPIILEKLDSNGFILTDSEKAYSSEILTREKINNEDIGFYSIYRKE